MPNTLAASRRSFAPSSGRPHVVPVLPAHSFNQDRLVRYLGDHMPSLGGPIAVSQFQGGQSNPTYLLTAGERSFVLRKRPSGELLASAHAIDREFRVLRALAGSDVPVPRVYYLCEDEEIIGRAFYVMEFVEGRVFTDGHLPALSSADRAAIYDSMNAVLAALHAIDYRSVGLEEFGQSSGYIVRQISRWSKQYTASQVEVCEEMNCLIAWVSDNVPADEDVAITHGDYRLGNLLIHPTKPIVVGVLDWELSTIGHPLADLAYNCQMYRLDASVPGGGALPLGIPSEQDYLAAYCRRVGRDSIAHWEFYLAFSFFRSAAILAGVLRRGLDGNASDAHAVQQGGLYSRYARIGWDIAQTAT